MQVPVFRPLAKKSDQVLLYSHTGPVLSQSRSVRAVRLVPGSCARMRLHPSVGGKDEINKEELMRVAHSGSRGRVGRTET